MWFWISFFPFVKLLSLLFLVTSVLSATLSYVCYPENGFLIVDCNVNYEAKYGCSTYSYNNIRFLNCRMQNLPRKFFKDYTYRIKTVDISNLDGETMANSLISNLTYLEKLLANFNKLTIIPEMMLSNTNLHYLDLSYNRIAHIETIGECGAKNLQILLLTNNNITTISGTTFNNLSQLMILDLSFNNLQHLAMDTFDHLTNLKNLSLAYTNLSHFDFGMLAGCHQLEMLNISGNHINKINIDFHSTVFRYLKGIDMNCSEIIEIDKFESQIFPSLNYLNLQNNRFSCSHLKSILSPFDRKDITVELNRNTNAQKSTTIRGVSCIEDDALVMMMMTTESIPTTQTIRTGSVIASDETNWDYSMELKNFHAAQQRMYQLMIIILIIVVIIVTLIIMSIFGIHLDLKRIHLFSRFRQNLFDRQIIHHHHLKDDQQESVAL